MRACLAACGPSFQTDIDVWHATAHPDVVPTIFAALGLDRPPSVEGRPIVEALLPTVVDQAAVTAGEIIQRKIKAARSFPNGALYRQSMVIGYESGGPNAGRLVSAEFSRTQEGSQTIPPAIDAKL
eukprot:SAG31_NODE_3719_length_3951_cov_2.328141_2_plen_126_part_00